MVEAWSVRTSGHDNSRVSVAAAPESWINAYGHEPSQLVDIFLFTNVITCFLFTDVARDGMLSGPNIEETEALARAGGLGVIASGGVATLEQVATLARRSTAGIEGAIIGQALYAGELALRDAIRVVSKTMAQ